MEREKPLLDSRKTEKEEQNKDQKSEFVAAVTFIVYIINTFSF